MIERFHTSGEKSWKPPDWYEEIQWKTPPTGKYPRLPEKPLKTLDEWMDLVKREYLGVDVADIMPLRMLPHFINTEANLRALRSFAWSVGDDNPLWINPAYAAKTKYGCNIAPPTFPLTIRLPSTPECGPPTWIFNTLSYYAGCDITSYDVIRLGDRFKYQKIHSDVIRKTGRTQGDFAILYAEIAIWNQHGKCPCKFTGWSIRPPAAGAAAGREGGRLLYQRDIYRYTEEELDQIASSVKGEARRGSKPRYWEDVEVGDKLDPVIKTPMLLGDFAMVHAGAGCRGFELSYLDMEDRAARERAGVKLESKVEDRRIKPHPITNWAPMTGGHEDILLCKGQAFPLPFDYGFCRSNESYHLIANWMGDDGFVRRLVCYMRRPLFYSDTMWWTGEVVDKHKSKDGCAVEINFRATNQLGWVVTPGKCTVLLPSRNEGPVQLPIPQLAS